MLPRFCARSGVGVAARGLLPGSRRGLRSLRGRTPGSNRGISGAGYHACWRAGRVLRGSPASAATLRRALRVARIAPLGRVTWRARNNGQAGPISPTLQGAPSLVIGLSRLAAVASMTEFAASVVDEMTMTAFPVTRGRYVAPAESGPAHGMVDGVRAPAIGGGATLRRIGGRLVCPRVTAAALQSQRAPLCHLS